MNRTQPNLQDDRSRVRFTPDLEFEVLTDKALRLACTHKHDIYGRPLSLLSDCHPLSHLRYKEQLGATYRQLAAIAHGVGMTYEERQHWYSLAASIPLSERHAGHILGKLKKGEQHKNVTTPAVRSTAVMIDQDDAQGDIRATAATDGGPGERHPTEGVRKDVT